MIETIQDMRKNPKGRAILFFGFYLLFFVVVILFVRLSGRNHTLADDYEKGNTVIGQVGSLLNENYAYQYRIITDGEEVIFDGKRMNKKESFQMNNQFYYYNGKECFVREDRWYEIPDPIVFHHLLEPSSISTLLEKAYYESKTDYESGQILYRYLVSVDTLNEIFMKNPSDLDLPNDTISIRLDEKHQLSTIVFQLDSFCKYHKVCQNNLKIEAEYSMFGEIISIDNSIMN